MTNAPICIYSVYTVRKTNQAFFVALFARLDSGLGFSRTNLHDDTDHFGFVQSRCVHFDDGSKDLQEDSAVTRRNQPLCVYEAEAFSLHGQFEAAFAFQRYEAIPTASNAKLLRMYAIPLVAMM